MNDNMVSIDSPKVENKVDLESKYKNLIQQKSQDLASTKAQIAQLRKAEDQLSVRAVELQGQLTLLQELLQNK